MEQSSIRRKKQKLFIELKDNLEYEITRQTVLTHIKVPLFTSGVMAKTELESSIEYLDEINLNEEEQRKRA